MFVYFRYYVSGCLLVFCSFVASSHSFAQDSLFVVTLGKPESSEVIEGLIQTSEGSLLMCGGTDSYSAGGDVDAFLIHTGKSGNISWARTYGGQSDDMALDARETSDGGSIIAGWTKSFGAGSYDFWVFKVDANGKMEWEKRYGGSGAEQAWSVDADGSNFLVTGGTESFGAGATDIWALKLDPDGNVIWQNTYGSTGDDAPPGDYEEYVARGLVDNTGHYIVSSSSNTLGHGDTDIWAARLNAGDGSLIWSYAYGDTDEETTWSIAESTIGGYFLSGTLSFQYPYEADLWALHIDTSGYVTWQKTFGVAGVWDESLYTSASPDGGAILGAFIEQGGSDWIASALKIDADGNLLWANQYKVSHLNWLNAVLQLDDGTVALAGVATNTITWNDDLMLARTNNNGKVGGCSYISPYTPNIITTSTTPHEVRITVGKTDVAPHATSSTEKSVSVPENTLCNGAPSTKIKNWIKSGFDIKVYPNPSLQDITIKIEGEGTGNFNLTIYNAAGHLACSQKIIKNRVKIITDEFAKGIYFYQIQAAENQEIIKQGKFIVH